MEERGDSRYLSREELFAMARKLTEYYPKQKDKDRTKQPWLGPLVLQDLLMFKPVLDLLLFLWFFMWMSIYVFHATINNPSAADTETA